MHTIISDKAHAQEWVFHILICCTLIFTVISVVFFFRSGDVGLDWIFQSFIMLHAWSRLYPDKLGCLCTKQTQQGYNILLVGLMISTIHQMENLMLTTKLPHTYKYSRGINFMNFVGDSALVKFLSYILEY